MLTKLLCASTVEGCWLSWGGRFLAGGLPLTDGSKGVEYRCLVCGRVFASAQGLRGHLKAHRGAYKVVSFLADAVFYEEFKRLCRAHGLTTCHMFNNFMWAMVQAFRRNMKVEWDPRTESLRAVSGSNPIVVNLSQYFAARPRGHGKYAPVCAVYRKLPTVFCAFMDGFVEDEKGVSVYCQYLGGNWVPSSQCAGCVKNRYRERNNE